jgi:hypothetical protein
VIIYDSCFFSIRLSATLMIFLKLLSLFIPGNVWSDARFPRLVSKYAIHCFFEVVIVSGRKLIHCSLLQVKPMSIADLAYRLVHNV